VIVVFHCAREGGGYLPRCMVSLLARPKKREVFNDNIEKCPLQSL
jgi:hypothetical protein